LRNDMKSRVIKAAVAVALVASSVNAQTPEQARQYAIFKNVSWRFYL